MINRLGGTCVHAAIAELVGETYYAKLVLEQDGRQLELDARPSDAINVAIRAKVPIFADESLLKEPRQAAKTDTDSQGDGGEPPQPVR